MWHKMCFFSEKRINVKRKLHHFIISHWSHILVRNTSVDRLSKFNKKIQANTPAVIYNLFSWGTIFTAAWAVILSCHQTPLTWILIWHYECMYAWNQSRRLVFLKPALCLYAVYFQPNIHSRTAVCKLLTQNEPSIS